MPFRSPLDIQRILRRCTSIRNILTMAQCMSPWNKDGYTLPCGKCYECKARRVSGWSFRLNKEAEGSTSALFVTLTYAPEHTPMSENGYMTLNKSDIQKFLKRYRKKHGTNTKIKYYLCGEYGGNTLRPHYHIILFNGNAEHIETAWGLGQIHIGKVNEASTGYTLKYLAKPSQIPKHRNDDRLKEFSLMSKKMGISYITPEMVKWHKKDLKNRMYIALKDGKKIAMPRYFKEKIYSVHQRHRISIHVQKQQIKKDLSTPVKIKLAQMEKDNLIRTNKARKSQKDQRLKTTI